MSVAKPKPDVEIGENFPGSKTRHGTASGWRLHQNLDERPCDACYRAKEAYDKDYRSQPDRVQKNRDNARAQGLAFTALRKAHPDEYAALYAKFKAEIASGGAA